MISTAEVFPKQNCVCKSDVSNCIKLFFVYNFSKI